MLRKFCAAHFVWPLFVWSLFVCSAFLSQVVHADTSSKPADLFNTYYLYKSHPAQPLSDNHAVLTLTAEGGRLLLPDVDLSLDWYVNEQQQIELIFEPKIISTVVVDLTCDEFSNNPYKDVLVTYQKMVIDVSELTSKGARFSTTLIGVTDYVAARCPDLPILINQDSTVVTTAGLHQPLDFIEPGKEISIPLSLKPAILGTLPSPLPSYRANVKSALLTLDDAGAAQSGSGRIQLAKVTSQGEWQYTSVPILWDVSALDRTLSIRGIGFELTLAYLANDQAGWPIVSVMNTDPERQNGWNLAIDMSVGKKVLSWNAQNVPGIYDFRPIFDNSFLYSWLEFTENGTGTLVHISDNNLNGVVDEREIIQRPMRWQIDAQGDLHFRYYKTPNGVASGADCLPDSFEPALGAGCNVNSNQKLTLLEGSFFNGQPVIAVQSENTYFYADLQVGSQVQPVLRAAIIYRRAFFRLNSRPYPIKPLVLGVTIPDDQLRDCLLAKNLVSITQLQALTCVGVNDVSGLQHFTELKSLTLTGGTGMSSLAMLKRLTKLSYLDLSNNQLEDVHIMALDAMVMAPGGELKLENNFITLSSINTLATMQQVDKLNLSGVGLTSVAGLNLPGSLTELVLNDNELTELNVTGATWSTLKTLSLNNTPLADLSFIAKLSALSTLYLDQTRLHQLTGLIGQLQLDRVFLRQTAAVSCQDIAAALAADPQLTIDTDGCYYSNGIRLTVGNGLELVSVEFADAAQNSLGQWVLVGQQLQFIPAANVQGWLRVSVVIRLSDGSSRTVTLELNVQPIEPKPRRHKLPWWIFAKAA